jgi:multifunctional beta-oxidation protein
LVTFAKTLAREGVKYNIQANAIAPVAASPMTQTIMPPEVLENLKPEHVAPVVAWLCHESCKETGQLYETGAGWTGQVKWELSNGAVFKPDESFTPSAVGETFLEGASSYRDQVAARWEEVVDFSNPTHPTKQGDIDLMVRYFPRCQTST